MFHVRGHSSGGSSTVPWAFMPRSGENGAVLWLASEDFNFVTGHSIVVDGGASVVKAGKNLTGRSKALR